MDLSKTLIKIFSKLILFVKYNLRNTEASIICEEKNPTIIPHIKHNY